MNAPLIVNPETLAMISSDPRFRSLLTPELISYPERFHFEGEERGRDGHRHEYGLTTFECSNPRARKHCGRRALPTIIRRDRMVAMQSRARAEHLRINLSLDYPQELAPEPEEQPIRWAQTSWDERGEMPLWL